MLIITVIFLYIFNDKIAKTYFFYHISPNYKYN